MNIDERARMIWYRLAGKDWLINLESWLIHRWQILTRGWSDRDIWSLDITLAGWLVPRLKLLKTAKHGIPMEAFPDGPEYLYPEGHELQGHHNEAGWAIATARWNQIMDEMIEGFQLCSEGTSTFGKPDQLAKIQKAFDHLAHWHGNLWD